MTIQDTIALWSCVVCSSVWASAGTFHGFVLSGVWLAIAGVMIYDVKHRTRKEPA